jgi:hypothetical protein
MKKRWVIFSSVMLAGLSAPQLGAQQAAAARSLPYVAVHDPEFISAAEASFMGPDDRVIGLMDGPTAKAYPAGILSQHGLVEDRSRSGPIAITW